MSVEFISALQQWLPMQADAAVRVLRRSTSSERDCDRARGQLDVIEALVRAVENPAEEFGSLWPLSEEDGEEEDDNVS